MYVAHGAARLYYEVRGAPTLPALLMIRGLARESRHWGELLDLLAPSFRLVLFDNRGVGRSSAPWERYTTATLADDAAAVLDAAGVPRAHVFGMSLGGMIAQELALRHPARVDRLALGCTRAAASAGGSMPRTTLVALARALGGDRASAIRRAAPLIVSREFLVAHPEVVDAWQRLNLAAPPSRHGVLLQVLAALTHDTRARLHELHAPTLVITGTADRMIPDGCSRYLAARITGARLVTLAGAGHDFAVERAADTARELVQFCA